MPPYGEDTPPSLFAPYGEYAEAFRFTAVVSDDGRSGMAGAPEAVVDDTTEAGFDIAVPDDIPADGGRTGTVTSAS
jgi:hypothetical protein